MQQSQPGPIPQTPAVLAQKEARHGELVAWRTLLGHDLLYQIPAPSSDQSGKRDSTTPLVCQGKGLSASDLIGLLSP